MGNSENNLKILEGFCGLDSYLEATSKPCENPSDDGEYRTIYREISEQTRRNIEKGKRKSKFSDDIYYGNN